MYIQTEETAMKKNERLNLAISISSLAHIGQKRFGNGESYILHPIRVMMKMKTVDEMIVAVLHDVVEDTDEKSPINWTIEMLTEAGFLKIHTDAISAMTKEEGGDYEEYLKNLKANKIARAVKLEDIEDNMNIFTLKKIAERDLIRLEKYHAARLYLLGD